MDNPTYVGLTRQSGLMREMQVVANNIANMATTGYRREGVIFAEHVAATGPGDPSLSMGNAVGRSISPVQGAISATGGQFDIAIEGDGFFLVETPEGEALTRAGNFIRNEGGELVTMNGHRLLDAGGAPVFVPATAQSVALFGRWHSLGRWPAADTDRSMGPGRSDRTVAPVRDPLPGGLGGRTSGRGALRASGARGIERQSGGRDRPHDRGAARL